MIRVYHIPRRNHLNFQPWPFDYARLETVALRSHRRPVEPRL